MSLSSPRSLIVSRTDNIGDVVLSLPIAFYLKTLFPDVELIFLGKPYTEPVIRSCRYVDQYWDKSLLETYDTSGIDGIVFLFPDQEIARWAYHREIPLRIGTSHRWWHWLYCNKRVSFSRRHSALHEAQLNFYLLQPLGYQGVPGLEELAEGFGLAAHPENLPPEILTLLDKSRLKVILHPKSKGSAREWPLDHYLQLAQMLPPEQAQLFVTGSAAEESLIKQALPGLFELLHVTNLAGKLSLQELIDFIGAADALVACSTGPLHLASALGKKAIGLYPNLVPIHPGRWKPLGKQAITLHINRPGCMDCHKKPQHCSCLESISASTVRQCLLEETSSC
jgi:heptosyltransferase-3